MKRAMDWQGATMNGTTSLTIDEIVGNFIVLPSTLHEQYTDPTLVRTRGSVLLNSGTTTTSGTNFFGIIEWPGEGGEDTLPAGPELPSPRDDPELDWIWWRGYAVRTGTGDVGANGRDKEFEIDSKAMRKIETGHGILMVAHNGGQTQGAFWASVRCLFKQ